jgi:hypothetical protein
MFAVARRFYLLFQQHCTYQNAASISKTLGQFSYHQVRSLGNNMVMMVPDTRSERTPNVVSVLHWLASDQRVEGFGLWLVFLA